MKFSHVMLRLILGMLCAVVLPCIAITTTTSAPGSSRVHVSQYDGVAVLRIPFPISTDHTHTSADAASISAKLDALIAEFGLKTWTRRRSWVDVQVPKGVYERFLGEVRGVLKEGVGGGNVVAMHSDLGQSLRAEWSGLGGEKNGDGEVRVSVQAEEIISQDWFNSYHPYDDHLRWLDDLVSSFPNNSQIVSSGTSFEGRDIKGVHIFGEGGAGTKPAVIWHGNVHAREWITSMTVEYLAYSLLNNYENSTDVKGVVDKFDYYIFPIVNPDGFVYSQTTDRMWRKNRQPPPSKSSNCFGRDLNRNWNISFSSPPNGASTDPCAEDYKGEFPNDTPEVKSLAAFIDDRANSGAGAIMYVDWHSYGMLFMYPYGYDCAKTLSTSDTTEFDSLVQGFARTVDGVHNASYTTGPICTTIYPTSGSSSDSTFDVSKIKYSFAAELRDDGAQGFVLPPSQIRISGEETWEGVMYLLKNMVPSSPTLTPSPTASISSRLRSGWLGLVMVVLTLSMRM